MQYDEELHGVDVYPGYQENLHANLRTFMECGWDVVSFPEGLALQENHCPALALD